MASQDSSAGTSQIRTTKTERSGLVLSVARVERNLRKGRYAERIGPESAVYLAGVLEYLSAELLELSGHAAIQNKKHRITPRHIMLAIKNDVELTELLKGVQIPGAGVNPYIHQVLLKTRSDKSNEMGNVRPTVGSQEI